VGPEARGGRGQGRAYTTNSVVIYAPPPISLGVLYAAHWLWLVQLVVRPLSVTRAVAVALAVGKGGSAVGDVHRAGGDVVGPQKAYLASLVMEDTEEIHKRVIIIIIIIIIIIRDEEI
jgi:hypothetical protein